ncbi:MAG: LAGLIDADG family homing endonuclease, partial [Patescibacteria group bacterium]
MVVNNNNKITWSKELAYASGLIASDGNLCEPRKRIQFKTADIELVENLKIALKVKTKTGVAKSILGKNHYYIIFTDAPLHDFLNSAGIHPRKSRTIKNVKVPNKFFRDFLRGLFDGDGTFYTFWDTRWPNSFGFQISFASASKDFIEWLKVKNSTLFGVKGFIRKGKAVYNLRYVKGDTRKLFKTMYYDKHLLFLTRKREKMVKSFKKDE